MSQKLILPIHHTELTASIDTISYFNKFGFHHYGCDMISVDGDRDIYASGNGTVAAVGYDNACGNVIAVVYPDAVNHLTEETQNVCIRYFHLDCAAVQEGQSVTQDTVLGRYGHTGIYAGTGPHLHTEADTDTGHVLHTPTVVSSNYLKGTAQGAYAFNSVKNTVLNALNLYHCKSGAPQAQTYMTAGDQYIRIEDRTLPVIS